MGKKIVLTGVNFGDTTLPVLPTYDPIESTGSLFLFDPSNGYGTFSGVPVSGSIVPNVVAPIAAAATGLSKSLVTGRVVTTGNVTGKFQIERSSKLGVHGMSTQGGSQTAPAYWSLKLHASLKDYLEANILTHQFYVSSWIRLTRKAITNSAIQSVLHWTQNTSNYAYHTSSGVPTTTPNTNKASNINTVTSDLASAGLIQLAVTGWTGDQQYITNDTEAYQPAFAIGAVDAWAGSNYNKCDSHILYRAYIEDLTVSGRSYADVAALDLSLFNTAFGAGGRFASDTYSDPAVAVP